MGPAKRRARLPNVAGKAVASSSPFGGAVSASTPVPARANSRATGRYVSPARSLSLPVYVRMDPSVEVTYLFHLRITEVQRRCQYLGRALLRHPSTSGGRDRHTANRKPAQ